MNKKRVVAIILIVILVLGLLVPMIVRASDEPGAAESGSIAGPEEGAGNAVSGELSGEDPSGGGENEENVPAGGDASGTESGEDGNGTADPAETGDTEEIPPDPAGSAENGSEADDPADEDPDQPSGEDGAPADGGTAPEEPAEEEEEEELMETLAEPVPEQTIAVKPGVYRIACASAPSLVLDVAGGSRAAKANIRVHKDNGSEAQKYIISRLENGHYLITSLKSMKALELQGGKTAARTNVWQYGINGSAAQEWVFTSPGDGTVRIRSAKSGMILSTAASPAGDVNVLVDSEAAPPSGETSGEEGEDGGEDPGNAEDAAPDTQHWTLTLLDAKRIFPDACFTLLSAKNRSMSLDVAAGTMAYAGNIQLHRANGSAAQKFSLRYKGNGYYQLIANCSALSLDVCGSKKTNGTNVQQHKVTGSAAQKWLVKPLSSGSCTLLSALSTGMAMDVKGGKMANGANIQIYRANGSAAQQFYFRPCREEMAVRKNCIVEIDPGHQFNADLSTEPVGPGAAQYKMKVSGGTRGQYTGLAEHELALSVALKLKKELEARSYTVYLTRTSGNVNISNKQRAEKAAKDNADLFVRIHANGAAPSLRGVMGIGPASNNPYLSKSVIADSQRLAKLLAKYQSRATGLPRYEDSFVNNMTGINWAKMPVAIIEMGFMTNPLDDRYMASDANQNVIAKGLADGIDAYYKGEKG